LAFLLQNGGGSDDGSVHERGDVPASSQLEDWMGFDEDDAVGN